MRNILLLFSVLVLLPGTIRAQLNKNLITQRIDSANAIRIDSVAIDSLQEVFLQRGLSSNDKLMAATKLVFRMAAARRYEDALKLCHQQITVSRNSQNDSAECVYTKLLGVTYYYMQQRQEALLYFEKALKQAELHGYYPIAYSCSNNIGGILLDLKEYNRAEKSLLQAISLMRTYGSKPEEIVITKRLLATLYDYQGKAKAAENIYRETIAYSLQNGDSISAAHAMTFYADLLWKQKQYQKAVSIGKQAIDLERKGANRNALLASLTMQRKYLIGQHSFRELVSLDSEIIALQAAIFSTDLNKEISETEVKYKMKELLYQQQLDAANANKKQQLLIMAFVGALLVTSLAFVVFYQRNKARQRERLEAEKTAAIILGEEQERIRMAAELHDGVGQMMSTAKMNLSALEQELADGDAGIREKYNGIIKLVDASCAEIRQVAHDLAPFWVMKLGLEDALKRLTQKAGGSMVQINLYCDPLPTSLDKVMSSTLFRVIQECINNALKHARASHIDVAVNLEKNGISVTVEDDGVGFSLSETAASGIGMENIRRRTHYLNGTVEWDSSPGNGTLVAISIPLK